MSRAARSCVRGSTTPPTLPSSGTTTRNGDACGRSAPRSGATSRDTSVVDALVELAVGKYGGVDVLVNNAALMAQIVMTTALDDSRADWDRAFAVNVTGAWQCTKAVVP